MPASVWIEVMEISLKHMHTYSLYLRGCVGEFKIEIIMRPCHLTWRSSTGIFNSLEEYVKECTKSINYVLRLISDKFEFWKTLIFGSLIIDHVPLLAFTPFPPRLFFRSLIVEPKPANLQ